jgi:hypothetical protein
MGFEDFAKKRKERLDDPELKKAHEEEWERVRESFGHMSDQAKTTCIGIIYHSLSIIGKTMMLIGGAGHTKGSAHEKSEKGKKEHEKDKKKASKHGAGHAETLGWQALEHGYDGMAQIVKLVTRIVVSSGRAAKYGVRRAAAI